jgi:hypothetical protein
MDEDGLFWLTKDFLHQLGFFNLHFYRPYSLSSLSPSLKPIFIYLFSLKKNKTVGSVPQGTILC